MSFDKNYFKEKSYIEIKTFKNCYNDYNNINDAGYGIYVIFKDDSILTKINKRSFPCPGIKLNYEDAKQKLDETGTTLLIGLPQMMYSTKYDLKNELYQLYATGLRFPARSFFGKLVFCLKNYDCLQVFYKKMDVVTARTNYMKLLQKHKNIYGHLPFANLSDRLPKQLFVYNHYPLP